VRKFPSVKGQQVVVALEAFGAPCSVQCAVCYGKQDDAPVSCRKARARRRTMQARAVVGHVVELACIASRRRAGPQYDQRSPSLQALQANRPRNVLKRFQDPQGSLSPSNPAWNHPNLLPAHLHTLHTLHTPGTIGQQPQQQVHTAVVVCLRPRESIRPDQRAVLRQARHKGSVPEWRLTYETVPRPWKAPLTLFHKALNFICDQVFGRGAEDASTEQRPFNNTRAITTLNFGRHPIAAFSWRPNPARSTRHVCMTCRGDIASCDAAEDTNYALSHPAVIHTTGCGMHQNDELRCTRAGSDQDP